MHFKQNENVYTTDGKHAGHIDRVVIDSRTNAVTHVVVRAGVLFTKDKVIPVEQIMPGPEGQQALQLDSQQLAELPDFAETHYVAMDEGTQGSAPPTVISYPPYPGGAPVVSDIGPKMRKETRLNIPDNTVPLKEGARVIGLDGEEVGHMEQVLTNPPGDRITHFMNVIGLLNKERRWIPISWVGSLRDNEVQLAVKSNTVEKLTVVEVA
jgi:uncharacterized protein YrrD